MKILFLCGALEPGRDGVGDYTRRLAGELIRQGHECMAVALHDKFVETKQDLTQEGVKVLRLPRSDSWKAKIRLAGEWADKFQPDWVSLQFVPYSFNAKGLPFGLGRTIRRIAPMARCHLMFHELWVGSSGAVPWRQRPIKFFQKLIIERLLSGFPNGSVTTNTDYYLGLLREMGSSANTRRLPLFGNIPRSNLARLDEVLLGEMRSHFVLLYFGSLPQNTASFIKTLKRAIALSPALPCFFISVGDAGSASDACRDAAIELLGGENVRILGYQSDKVISALMQQGDLFLTRAKTISWQKSSAVMTALDHGMKVIGEDFESLDASASVDVRCVAEQMVDLLAITPDSLSLTRGNWTGRG